MSFEKKIRRANTVTAVKDMTMEQKKAYLMEKQEAERRLKQRASMTRHWLKIRDEQCNKIALFVANSIAPMWYIFAVDRFVYGVGMGWLVNAVEKEIGKAWLIRAICLPFNLLSLVLSFIFLKPIHYIRVLMINAGLTYRDEVVNHKVQIRRIYKWGKLIDESRWE